MSNKIVDKIIDEIYCEAYLLDKEHYRINPNPIINRAPLTPRLWNLCWNLKENYINKGSLKVEKSEAGEITGNSFNVTFVHQWWENERTDYADPNQYRPRSRKETHKLTIPFSTNENSFVIDELLNFGETHYSFID